MRLELAVPPEAAGERLDRFLAASEALGSRAEVERLIAEERVTVDGAARAKSHRLQSGAHVTVDAPERPSPGLEPEDLGVTIAYEDDYLLVVDKPAGVVVHPSAGHARGTLVHGLVSHGIEGGGQPERPGVVHRLDRDTSGLLVVARDPETHRRLKRLLRRREIERQYLVLVRGRPRSWQGRIEAAIGRDRRDPTRMSIDTDTPREAITHFEVVELLPDHALLRVRLETGRTHQIRVHLAAINLPVSGDSTYGRPGDLGLARQFLHAARLAFQHPVTGKAVELGSPLPADLGAALALARGVSSSGGGKAQSVR
jgi:23S rRNA pseudouridine1911/1915/1917 synthase